MGDHLIDGDFQSDKYPTCPRGKVPLSVKDPTAQDLLWEYAQRRRIVDATFAADLETALRGAGYSPNVCDYCGEPGNVLKPEGLTDADTGSGPVTTYDAGEFHGDCLSEMMESDGDGELTS